jgi:hypothetical protein
MKILWPDFQTENAVNGIVNRFHSITWVSCNQFLFFLYGDPIKSNLILPGFILSKYFYLADWMPGDAWIAGFRLPFRHLVSFLLESHAMYLLVCWILITLLTFDSVLPLLSFIAQLKKRTHKNPNCIIWFQIISISPVVLQRKLECKVT